MGLEREVTAFKGQAFDSLIVLDVFNLLFLQGLHRGVRDENHGSEVRT